MDEQIPKRKSRFTEAQIMGALRQTEGKRHLELAPFSTGHSGITMEA